MTTSAVIAEVAFLLTSRNVYAMDVSEASTRMETLISIPNVQFDQKTEALVALTIWERRPSMGFVDALMVAMAESASAPLATFDRGFERFPSIERHPWRTPGSG